MSINNYRDRDYPEPAKQPVYYEERLQCASKMSRGTMLGQSEIEPEKDADYPSVYEMLGDTEKAIQVLNSQIDELSEQIKSVLCDESPQTDPVRGPRVSNSPLTGQIGYLADMIDGLSDRVHRIRRRVTL